MKVKKVLSVILAIFLVIGMSATIFADGSGKKDVGEHEHKLMKMANAACHYEECTICFELFNVGDHTYKDCKCTVCGKITEKGIHCSKPTVKHSGFYFFDNDIVNLFSGAFSAILATVICALI